MVENCFRNDRTTEEGPSYLPSAIFTSNMDTPRRLMALGKFPWRCIERISCSISERAALK